MKFMASLFFFALFLAATTALSTSRDERRCRMEMQRHSMDSCKDFMKYGQRSQQGIVMMDVEDDENDEMMAPRECCNQLRSVSTECRCPVIRNMMQEIMREEQGGRQQNQQCRGERCKEMMMRGRFLPAMCNIQPQICSMKQQESRY